MPTSPGHRIPPPPDAIPMRFWHVIGHSVYDGDRKAGTFHDIEDAQIAVYCQTLMVAEYNELIKERDKT